MLAPDGTLCVEMLEPTEKYLDQMLQFMVVGNMLFRATRSEQINLNYISQQIGIVTNTTAPSSEDVLAGCGAQTSCRGSQEYYGPMNTCLNPRCEDYYFQTLDEDTKECHLTELFQFTVLFGLVVFAVV